MDKNQMLTIISYTDPERYLASECVQKIKKKLIFFCFLISSKPAHYFILKPMGDLINQEKSIKSRELKFSAKGNNL